MHNHTFYQWVNAAKLLVFLICLAFLWLLVAIGLYTPQGENGGFFGVDFWVFFGLLVVGVVLYRKVPTWLLRRQGLSDRRIARLKRIVAIAQEEGCPAVWPCKLLYFAVFCLCITASVLLVFVLNARFPHHAWQLMMTNEFCRSFVTPVLSILLYQTVDGYLVLRRHEKKRCRRAARLSGRYFA